MYEVDQDQYALKYRTGPGWLYVAIWLAWVAANILAFIVGENLGEAVESLFRGSDTLGLRLLSTEGHVEQAQADGYLAVIAGGLTAGGVLGIAQGLVLAPFLKWKNAAAWAAVTTLARAARWVVLFVISQQLAGLVVDRQIDGACLLVGFLGGIGCIAGILLGYPQSIILRRRVEHHRWWLLANIPGPVIASLAVSMGLYVERQNVLRDVTTLMAATVGAVVTGIALTDLLRRPMPQAEWWQNFKPRKERAKKEPVEEMVLGSVHYGSTQPKLPKETDTPSRED